MAAQTFADTAGSLSVHRTGALLRVRRAARHWAWIVAFGIVLYRVPFQLTNDYQLRVVTLALTYAAFAASVELVMGKAGQISLGHGGFFAIGAYGEAIFQTRYGVAPWPALVLAIVLGAVCGLAVGVTTLRVTGPYLAVVTIGFALTAQALLYVFSGLTNGAVGVAGIHYLSNIGFGGGALGTYYGAAVVVLVGLVAARLLGWGNVGLTLRALCDSTTLSRAAGVDVRFTKLLVFSGSAALAAASGAVFATLGYISPETFSMQLSIFPVVAVVLGGIGTLAGPLLGAFLLYGFDQATARAAQGSAVMYGVLLMALPLALPKGLVGLGGRFGQFALRRFGRWRHRSGSMEEVRPPTRPARPHLGVAGSRVGLQVVGASRTFGTVRAVDDVSISVAPGDVVGLVGPNGSGKSTLLNIASGYYAPDRGQVMLGDRDVTRLALHHRVRLGLLPAFQTAQLMDTRSIRDNLTVGGVARARWGRTTSTELVDQVASVLDIGISLETPAGGLPEGTRKVVELGRTLLGAPKVLLLDEPTSGLSLEEVERVAGILRMLGESGVTVLLADHNFEFVGRVCRRLVVLDRGKVLAEGHPDALRADPAVIESYLGSGHEDGAGDGRAAGALRD